MNSSPPPNGDRNGAPVPPARPTVPKSPRVALEPERVPPPKKHSKRARHPLVIAGNAIFMVLVVISVTVGAGLYFGKQRFEAPGPLAEDKVVNIPRGLGIKDIADLLVREGVIDQPYVFMGGVIALKARGELKSGEYQFNKRASVADVVDTIIENKVVQHTLTIAEGLTSEQIVAKLLETDALSGQIKEIPREGTLLPETYKFTRGMSREQLIQRMQQAHKRVLTEVWERRMPDIPIKTPEQLVTLASIVEKETGKPDERTRVAAVFVNRLKAKMKLQSDPTIIYGLTGGKGALGRPIMRSEIEQPTPYNTYVIEGLPPGPIANPGRASLEAAANPARTKELYFVADGTGGHVFSDNYAEHQKNVAKLRALEQGAAPPPTVTPAPTPSGPTVIEPPPSSTTPPANGRRNNNRR
ncbi:endolytic transglycosylase MltG [Microbacteriaceae bacterium K1510]|nr:endolytic transglycosylase MltG [Microbacteriaceae bacterium K1510]